MTRPLPPNAWVAFAPFLAFVRANNSNNLKYSAIPLEGMITELTGATSSTVDLAKASNTTFFKSHVDAKSTVAMQSSKDTKQQPIDRSSSSSAPTIKKKRSNCIIQ